LPFATAMKCSTTYKNVYEFVYESINDRKRRNNVCPIKKYLHDCQVQKMSVGEESVCPNSKIVHMIGKLWL
jgi:hypothetical protein